MMNIFKIIRRAFAPVPPVVNGSWHWRNERMKNLRHAPKEIPFIFRFVAVLVIAASLGAFINALLNGEKGN